MKEKGNQYDFKRVKKESQSIYMKAFETKHPKTKEDYDALIRFANNEILEWEEFRKECIERKQNL